MSSNFQMALYATLWFETGGLFDPNIPGCIDGTDHERCGLVNDPDDAGGLTKYGIAQRFHPELDVLNIDFATASEVYYSDYWVKSGCDKISGLVAAYVFDMSVMSGVYEGDKLLQMALGVAADGIFGPQTDAAEEQQAMISEQVILDKMVKLRQNFYIMITQLRPSQMKFLNGWTRRAQTYMGQYAKYA